METASMTFEELVEKILRDEGFRKELAVNPRRALERIHVTPTDDMIRALEQFDKESARRVAKAFKWRFIT